MKFDIELLNEYKTLLQTTNLQAGYQEFIDLFKYVRAALEREMFAYQFQKTITENRMDFAYFQLSNDRLKKKGLKISIVFIHKAFRFEVWLSGYNRQYQSHYYQIFFNDHRHFKITNNPQKTDYILKYPLLLDLSDEESVVLEIKKAILEIVDYCKGRV